MSDETDETRAQIRAAVRHFSPQAAALGSRTGYCCEYCGLDFLANEVNFKLWEEDHIVPRSCGGSPMDFDNMTVACLPCNTKYKGQWDPRTIAGATATRAQLIDAARTKIYELRALVAEDLRLLRAVRNEGP